MDAAKLAKVLASHRSWLANAGGCRANLSMANLIKADLSLADLSWADLSGADLSWANLGGANLSKADLSRANLVGANLSGANLVEADLCRADLSMADLRRAILLGAELGGAILGVAVLNHAILIGANLAHAVGLCPLAAARLEILPRAGEVRGWKRCFHGVLVELIVPDGVERSNATGRMCRARMVRVVAVHGADVGVSLHDHRLKYRVGEVVECDRWEPNRWVEFGGGIHFYLTREEAEAH